MSRFHLVDTATGEVIRELEQGWSVTPTRSRRRRTKQAHTRVIRDATIAAGVLLGVWLSYAVMP